MKKYSYLYLTIDRDTLPSGSGTLIAGSELKSASSPYYPLGQEFPNLELTWRIEAARDDTVVTIIVSELHVER